MAVQDPQPPKAAARAGRFVRQQTGDDGFWAFEPVDLPPVPPVTISDERAAALDVANHSLGRLDGSTAPLPEPNLLVYSFVRKEAVLSSQIEGTQSTLVDLLALENDVVPGVPSDDARETSNYIAAMSYGLSEIQRSGGLPISSRLLRDIHGILLHSGRGSDKDPGEFRRSQNWIGGTRPSNARFVPPPWTSVETHMGALERFIHEPAPERRVLVRAALAHVQLETIHPFLDGNGRVGRLLITLLIASAGVLRQPLLYLSLFFKRNRALYYEKLERVRTEGAWEEWIDFFLEGVTEVADSTTATAERIVRLIDRDRADIDRLGRAAGSAHRVHEWAAQRMVVEPRRAATGLGLAAPTVYGAIARLEDRGILREVTGRKRGRLWAYDEYLELMSEDTEPL